MHPMEWVRTEGGYDRWSCLAVALALMYVVLGVALLVTAVLSLREGTIGQAIFSVLLVPPCVWAARRSWRDRHP